MDHRTPLPEAPANACPASTLHNNPPDPHGGRAAPTDAPDFWDWLKACNSIRGALTSNSRVLGRNQGYLWELIRERYYPVPIEMIARIGTLFGAPSAWVEYWQEDAIGRWKAAPRGSASLLARAGLYTAPTMPCVDCGTPFYACDYEQGARRCPECQRKRGVGSPKRYAAKNRGMAFIDNLLKQQGRLRKEVSKAIGAHPNYLGLAAQRGHWYPPQAIAEAIAHELGVAFSDLRGYLDGTLEDYFREIWPIRASAYALADDADRAAGHGPVYRDQVRGAVEAGDEGVLRALRDRLRTLPRKTHPNNDGGAKNLKGKPRPREVVDRYAASNKARWARMTPDERRVATAHLQTAPMRIKRVIKSICTSKGPGYIQEKFKYYVQWAIDRYGSEGITVGLAEHIIRDALKPSKKRGRTPDWNHPHICTLPISVSWEEVATILRGDPELARTCRVAHTTFHKGTGVAKCQGMAGRPNRAV